MLSNQEIREVKNYLNHKDMDFVGIFKTLSDTNRCKIFIALTDGSTISVGIVAKVLNISMPLASQHLKILLHSGLIKKEKVGQKVYYKLERNNSVLNSIIKVVK